MSGSDQIHILPTETYFSIVKQMLDETGQARVRVTGMSMWPLLYHMRDSVVISKPENGVIHAGDIVLYDRQNGRYALHRVVQLKKDSFTMVGDNQWYLDRNLSYDQIVGVVTQIDRNGRSISHDNLFIKTYALFVVCLSFPRIYLRKAIKKLSYFFRGLRQPDSH